MSLQCPRALITAHYTAEGSLVVRGSFRSIRATRPLFLTHTPFTSPEVCIPPGDRKLRAEHRSGLQVRSTLRYLLQTLYSHNTVFTIIHIRY